MPSGYKLSKIYVGSQQVRPSGGLPREYQEVEYIYNTSTGPYINTGVTPTINTISQIKFMNLSWTGDVIYGHQGTSDNNDYRLFNYSQYMYYDFNTSRIMGNTYSLQTNTLYEFELGNYYVKNVGGSTNIISGTTLTSYSSPYPIYLNGVSKSTNRWYYVKIWNGDTLVRDLVPCYRKQDTVIGMYDLVNDTFYTNAGSGSFSKGNDV